MTDDELEDGIDHEVERAGAAAAAPAPPADVVPPAVAAQRAAAVRVMTQEQTDDLTAVRCIVCGEETKVLSCIVDAVKKWNQDERERAEAAENTPTPYTPQFIGNRQIATCMGECSAKYRAWQNSEADKVFATTRAAWKAMRENRLSPEDAAWLRQQGHGRDVDEYFRNPKPAAGEGHHE